jgi:hypothetical protein
MEFETDGPYRVERRSDGLYILGRGLLCPVETIEEADEMLRKLRNAPECAIISFFHCKRCLMSKPQNQSAKEWARISAGFTSFGYIQLWCVRHDVVITTLQPVCGGTVEVQ